MDEISAFRELIQNTSVMTDEELQRLIHVAKQEKRTFHIEAMLYYLIRQPNLTNSQFETIRQHCDNVQYPSPGFKRFITRESLMRELKNNPLAEELFQKCLTSGEGDVQKHLLSSRKLSRR